MTSLHAASPARRRTRGSGRNGPASIAAARRRTEALGYREQGYTFAEIGTAMRVSRARAYQLVTEGLTSLGAEVRENVRQLELMRIDQMQTAVFLRATQGEVAAVLTVLKIMERRSKLLGLDLTVNQGQREREAPKTTSQEEARTHLAEKMAAMFECLAGATNF